MKHLCMLLAGVCVVAATATMIFADPAAPADCECGPPTCKYCKLHVEKEKIKKSCWKVERKQICIPEVRFPWSKLHACRHHGCRGCAECCEPRCARVRTVRYLDKHSYECGEECVYSWEVEEACICTPGVPCEHPGCPAGQIVPGGEFIPGGLPVPDAAPPLPTAPVPAPPTIPPAVPPAAEQAAPTTRSAAGAVKTSPIRRTGFSLQRIFRR